MNKLDVLPISLYSQMRIYKNDHFLLIKKKLIPN